MEEIEQLGEEFPDAIFFILFYFFLSSKLLVIALMVLLTSAGYQSYFQAKLIKSGFMEKEYRKEESHITCLILTW